MRIEVVDQAGWTEAWCACGRFAVVLAPRESAALVVDSLGELLSHARRCERQGGDSGHSGAAGATVYQRLLDERYPTVRRGNQS